MLVHGSNMEYPTCWKVYPKHPTMLELHTKPLHILILEVKGSMKQGKSWLNSHWKIIADINVLHEPSNTRVCPSASTSAASGSNLGVAILVCLDIVLPQEKASKHSPGFETSLHKRCGPQKGNRTSSLNFIQEKSARLTSLAFNLVVN